MNKTLLGMLSTLLENQKTRWHEMVNKMTFSYNATPRDSTGYSPYFLSFGREPKLHFDYSFGQEDSGRRTDTVKYVDRWKKQMDEACRIAFERSSARKKKDQERWKSKSHLVTLKVGDRILIRNTETGGPGKLRSYWEQKVCRVKRVGGSGGVVYSVQPENAPKAKIRVVHGNMIMPCGNIQVNVKEEKKKKNAKTEVKIQNTVSDELDDSEVEEWWITQEGREIQSRGKNQRRQYCHKMQ